MNQPMCHNCFKDNPRPDEFADAIIGWVVVRTVIEQYTGKGQVTLVRHDEPKYFCPSCNAINEECVTSHTQKGDVKEDDETSKEEKRHHSDLR